MDKRKGVIILSVGIILLLFLQYDLNAQDEYTRVENHEEFTDLLKKHSDDLNTLQAEFTQQKHLQYLDAALNSSGKFWFQGPGNVRWEYTTPYKYILILNEGKLKMISDNTNSEFSTNSNEMFRQINDLIVSSVSGNIYQVDDYDVTTYENSKRYRVVLKPRSEYIREVLEIMELWFNKENYLVEEVRMTEKSGDYTHIKFSNQRINEALPQNIFTP